MRTRWLYGHDYKGCAGVTANTTPDAEQLELVGADRVLTPYADATVEAVDNLFGESGKQSPWLDNKRKVSR